MSPDAGSGLQLELHDYVQILRRRRVSLLLVVFLVVSAALVTSLLQAPVYAATSEVLLQRRGSETIFDPDTGQPNDPQRAVQTEIRIMTSEQVERAVREKLGYAPRVVASSAGQTNVVKIRAEHADRRKAVDIANAYASSYIDVRRAQAVDDVLAAVAQVQRTITEIHLLAEAATGPEKDALSQQEAAFKGKLSELRVTAGLQSGGAQLVKSARATTDPVRPKPVRDAGIALVVGLFLGVAVALLREYFDDTIKTREDLKRAAPDLSVLSSIPAVADWKDRKAAQVVSLTSPTSAPAEAYRALRTSIQFLGIDKPHRSLQIISANAHEGKTTTLANLGVALARAGSRVVIVCADLRRPRVHEFFGLSNSVGFTSVLLGEVPLAGALQGVPGLTTLYVLASGPLPPNPSELLQSQRAVQLFGHLHAQSDFVLIDSPPVLPVTDGLVMSKQVDGTIVVCSAGKTSRKELARALDMLHQVQAPVIGAVLNGVTEASGYGGYSYEYYGAAGPSGNGNGVGSEASRRARRRAASKVGRRRAASKVSR